MNYRYFIPTAILVASLAFVSSAHADQAVGWYFGKWNCMWGKSITTINIAGEGDGVVVGRVKDGRSPEVNLRLTSANASTISLQGEGNSIITMRLTPGSNPKRTEGTGTIDGLAEPLICARHPATPHGSAIAQAEIRSAAAGKCLDAAGGKPADGTPIISWSCHGGSNQTWTVTEKGEIRGLGGKCFDVAGGNPADGTPIVLWACHGGPNQTWTVTEKLEIRGLGGKCLDAAGGNPADGTPIILWACHGGTNQKWSFMKKGTP